VVLLKSIRGKNAAETSAIKGPSQQSHVKKNKKKQHTGKISSNSRQKLQNDTTMKAEVLKDTLLNNTINESKPIPVENR
jgi:hypothetical protein